MPLETQFPREGQPSADESRASAFVEIDCTGVAQHELRELYEGLALACRRLDAGAVLVRAGESDSPGYGELRNALASLLLEGVSPSFRLAFCAPSRPRPGFRALAEDLTRLDIAARWFDDEAAARAWLSGLDRP